MEGTRMLNENRSCMEIALSGDTYAWREVE